MTGEALALDKQELTYSDVDRLCKRHLANRARLEGSTIVRYQSQEIQRFRPAHPGVSAYLVERIDFDRAFKQLDKRHQKALIAWYGYEARLSIDDLADAWGCHRATVIRRKHRAVEALRQILTKCDWMG